MISAEVRLKGQVTQYSVEAELHRDCFNIVAQSMILYSANHFKLAFSICQHWFSATLFTLEFKSPRPNKVLGKWLAGRQP
jgi:hypothetical protein